MSVDIPDVWLSFDGNGKDFPVNVRYISVSYDSSATTWSSSGPIMATLSGLKTVLTLDCEAAPPKADWGALIVGRDVVPISRIRTTGGERVEMRILVPDRGSAILSDIRWMPMFKSAYWGP